MKFKALILIGTSVMILTGCNSEETKEGDVQANKDTETTTEEATTADTTDNEEVETDSASEEYDSGLLNLNETEAGWINSEGELGGNSEYITTGLIDYDPAKQYELSHGAYIAYYSGDSFIKTSQQEFEGPIEQVPEADQIRVSYHSSFEGSINLQEQ